MVHSPVPYPEMAPRAPEGEIDLRALIPGDGPVELDIGFGRGQSVFNRLNVSPRSRLIGIEIKNKWAYKVAQRVARLELPAVIWSGDAKEILGRSGPAATVDSAFVHFPDPWWKKRHFKRRLLTDAFLCELGRLFRVGGQLLIQTDVPDRAVLYRELLKNHSMFRLEPEPVENPFGCISNRERRALEEDVRVYRLLATRLQEA